MATNPSVRLDLGALLAAVENAAPVAAVDALADLLASALGARELSFLISDFSGQALVRLGSAGSATATRTQGQESGERTGSPQGRALAAQTVEHETTAAGT